MGVARVGATLRDVERENIAGKGCATAPVAWSECGSLRKGKTNVFLCLRGFRGVASSSLDFFRAMTRRWIACGPEQ